MEYLDREGGKYLATKLKSYVNDKVADLPSGGTVDLSNYYTKSEVNKIVGNISGGSSGTGKDGVGISNMKLVNYELIITLTDGTEHNLGNIRGEKGTDGVNGKDGAKGQDGFSPTIEVTNITDGHKVTITDKNGAKSFNVKDGKDGTNGSGSADLSGYYTKSEVDSKLNSIEVEPTKDLLYETVVANGGAVKNTEEVDVPQDNKLSEIILATKNGNEVTGNADGKYLVGFNTSKTQEELDAEFPIEFENTHYLLASSHTLEELSKIRTYEKCKEIVYLLIACGGNNKPRKLYFVKQYYKFTSYDTGMQKCERTYLDPAGYKMDVLEHMKNLKYIYSAATTYNGSTNDPFIYFYADTTINPVHIIDTYITHDYSKALKTNHYSLAEWGNKLDNIKNGDKGADGVSPTVTVTGTDTGHTVAITDVNGTQSFDVLNGKDGKDGVGGGSSGGGADGIYSTDETAIGTWIDGKTIYRKVIQLPTLDSIDGNFDMTTVNLDLSTEFLVNVRPIWKYGEASPSWIFGNYATFGLDTYTSSTSNISSILNENMKGQLYISADFSAKSKTIMVWRGKNMRGYACTLIVEYTKS